VIPARKCAPRRILAGAPAAEPGIGAFRAARPGHVAEGHGDARIERVDRAVPVRIVDEEDLEIERTEGRRAAGAASLKAWNAPIGDTCALAQVSPVAAGLDLPQGRA
jgi:hypothetical protein